MYLKVKTGYESNGWRIYECHKPQWHRYTRKTWEAEGLVNANDDTQYDVFVYSAPSIPADQSVVYVDEDVIVVSFYDEFEQPTEVHGVLEMYLLNDKGTTIQRIN